MHENCTSLGRFTNLKNTSCITEAQCIVNNSQLNGSTCIQPDLCPDNLYVNKDLRTCVNYTSCLETGGVILMNVSKGVIECTSSCTENNVKVNGETCNNINDCPDN